MAIAYRFPSGAACHSLKAWSAVGAPAEWRGALYALALAEWAAGRQVPGGSSDHMPADPSTPKRGLRQSWDSRRSRQMSAIWDNSENIFYRPWPSATFECVAGSAGTWR